MLFDSRITAVSVDEPKHTKYFEFRTYDLSVNSKKYWYEIPQILVTDIDLIEKLNQAKSGNTITVGGKQYTITLVYPL